ncbi:thioesterase family protein, partial [Alcanivorax sp. HI0083]|uniref:thioesterase family protein n=1 Tax=Alcanivorax sp. HI0083 TaxID=1822258 RepID=UPI000AB0A2DD
MARVKLDLPEQFLYTHTINVRMTDLNTGKHVGNDQMISLLSEARYRFFCDIDYSQERIVVTDLVASYRAESFAQDDLQFGVGLMDFN